MKAKGTERELVAEAATLLNLLQDIRDELRYIRQEVRDSLNASANRCSLDAEELLTVQQVAAELQVIPPTVRAWTNLARCRRAGQGTVGSPAASIGFAGQTWRLLSPRLGASAVVDPSS